MWFSHGPVVCKGRVAGAEEVCGFGICFDFIIDMGKGKQFGHGKERCRGENAVFKQPRPFEICDARERGGLVSVSMKEGPVWVPGVIRGVAGWFGNGRVEMSVGC